MDPLEVSSDLDWPVGDQGTLLRYDNDHGDGTHHRHVGGELDPDYTFPGSITEIHARFWEGIGVEPFGPSPEDYDL